MKFKVVKNEELIKAKLEKLGLLHLFGDCELGNGMDMLISFKDYIFFWYQNPLPGEGGFHYSKVEKHRHHEFIQKIVDIGDGDISVLMIPDNSSFVCNDAGITATV